MYNDANKRTVIIILQTKMHYLKDFSLLQDITEMHSVNKQSYHSTCKNDSGQVVHTHTCTSITKQYNLVLAKGW